MTIYKYDACKKEIKDYRTMVGIAYRSIMPTCSLCEKCGEPILALLRKYGLEKAKDAPVRPTQDQ